MLIASTSDRYDNITSLIIILSKWGTKKKKNHKNKNILHKHSVHNIQKSPQYHPVNGLFLFFVCPIWLTLFSFFSIVIASIAYNNPVYGAGIQTHKHSVVSPLPQLPEHGSLPNVLFLYYSIS